MEKCLYGSTRYMTTAVKQNRQENGDTWYMSQDMFKLVSLLMANGTLMDYRVLTSSVANGM
mgnify:CR=1 FL=1